MGCITVMENPDEYIDHGARRLAMSALEKIEGHEKLCAERWANVHRIISGINKRQWWIITLLITGQAAIIGLLIENGI